MLFRPLAPSWGVTVVRVTMGVILVVAAWDKITAGGLFGFIPAVANFGVPIPQFFGTLIPLLEGIGGILVLTGLGVRWVAMLFIVEFAVNVFVLKMPRQPPFGGWNSLRIDLMLLAGAIMLFLVGPGELALEKLLRRRREEQPLGAAVQYR